MGRSNLVDGNSRNLSKAGWSWGCVSVIASSGRTVWIADAHRDDGKPFVVRAGIADARPKGRFKESFELYSKAYIFVKTRLYAEVLCNRLRSPILREGAEGVRFELTRPFGLPVFKTGAINRSATPPENW